MEKGVKILDYSNVRKILVLDSQEEVNQKLENHWTLLSIEKESNESKTTIKFVLGWTHSKSQEEYLSNLENYAF
jgi:hypothetical protein